MDSAVDTTFALRALRNTSAFRSRHELLSLRCSRSSDYVAAAPTSASRQRGHHQPAADYPGAFARVSPSGTASRLPRRGQSAASPRFDFQQHSTLPQVSAPAQTSPRRSTDSSISSITSARTTRSSHCHIPGLDGPIGAIVNHRPEMTRKQLFVSRSACADRVSLLDEEALDHASTITARTSCTRAVSATRLCHGQISSPPRSASRSPRAGNRRNPDTRKSSSTR